MPRRIVSTADAPSAIGTYSQAVAAGDTVYLSGQIPLDPATGELVTGDIAAQIHRVFQNLSAVAKASGGAFRAHVMRVKKDAGEFDLHTTGLHRHHLDFQMIYILKGWIRFTYEGHGEHTFGPGDCCMQPAGIVHNELDCSDDLELLEITSPASYKTAAIDG